MSLLFNRDHTSVLHALRKPEGWEHGDGAKDWSRGSLNRFSTRSRNPAKKARNAAMMERRKQGAEIKELASDFGLTPAGVRTICRASKV
jgi:hypothetical protein